MTIALSFGEPLWLLLVALPLMPSLWRRLRGRHHAYAAPSLLPWVVLGTPPRRWWSRNTAYGLAWLLLALAAAGPRLPTEAPHQASATGPDVIMVVDLSRSMDAADVAPNRRRRAILELFESLDHTSGRIGVVVYAGRPHLYVPLTPDRQALRFYLASLDRLVLPTEGSAVAPALDLARTTLAGRPGTVVLLTDGDLAHPEQTSEAARALAAAGGRLHVLGLGSPEGEAIPLAAGGWLEQRGQPVISRLDERHLETLAQLGGGNYQRVSDDDSEWAALFSDRDAPETAEAQWQELYPWLLLPGVLLLFIALMPYGFGRSVASGLLALLLLPLLPRPSVAAEETAAAYQAFQQREYATAAALYARLPGHTGRMGEGASHYRAGDFAGAARAFTAAVLDARDEAGRADALFNLGGALFRLGDYGGAVQVFGDVLHYRPGDAAATHNRRVAEALLQAVLERQRGGGAAQAGRGPRSARAAEGIAVGEASRLSLDDARQRETALPSLPGEAEILIQRGLARIGLAAQEEAAAGSAAWQQDLAAARLSMLVLEDHPADLWNRLFEVEEGFPAPLQEPRALPGVAPW